MTNLGIIDKINIEEGINHYELSTGEAQHHIICKLCGYIRKIDLCPFKEMEKDKLEDIGFQAIEHKFEIYGLCSKCKNKKS